MMTLFEYPFSIRLERVVLNALVAGIFVIGNASVQPAGSQEDHSAHQQHMLTDEQFAELRSKVELYQDLTDEQIVENMSRMRNLGGMLSDATVVGEVGVLAMAHGYTDEGNQQWMDRFDIISGDYPTGYGMGMAMMGSDHIQRAIDGLEAAGAKKILVLRTETGDTNSLQQQWQYIFGRRDDSSYLSVPRVTSNAELIWGPTPTAHPIMGQIMLEHAQQLSVDPTNELVMILGHGPMTPKENQMELAIMATHANVIQEGGGFKDVKYWNVQDDLPPDQRAENVAKIRGWINEAKDQGMDVIVVTNVLTKSGVMGRIERDVEGLDVKFNNTGLMENPRFADWIKAAVKENLS